MKLRKIELRSVDVGDKEPLTYAGVIKTVISTPGSAGLSCDELLLCVQLVADLTAATNRKEEYLLITDEQYSFLKARLEAFRWGATHPAFGQFVQYVRNLPLAEVQEVKT